MLMCAGNPQEGDISSSLSGLLGYTIYFSDCAPEIPLGNELLSEKLLKNYEILCFTVT
jgi:hypothetical protein